MFYYTKFEPVSLNKEYIKYKDKHEKHAEVKMISQIGKALSGQFPADDIEMQGAAKKKKRVVMKMGVKKVLKKVLMRKRVVVVKERRTN